MLCLMQEIWDHSGNQRKKKGSAFPGAPDLYRETVYRRKAGDKSFQVLHSLIHDDEEEETAFLAQEVGAGTINPAPSSQ